MKQYQDSPTQGQFSNRRLGLVETTTADGSWHNTSIEVKTGSEILWTIQVTARIGQVSYPLKLLDRARIHDVFHVSLLKKFEGTAPSDVPQLPQILHGKVVPSPERVMRARLKRGVWELMVKWQG
jgi:hypothetical protein